MNQQDEKLKDLVLYLIKDDYYFGSIHALVSTFDKNKISQLYEGKSPDGLGNNRSKEEILDITLLACKINSLRNIIYYLSGNKNDWEIIKLFWLNHPDLKNLQKIYDENPATGRERILKELETKYKITQKKMKKNIMK